MTSLPDALRPWREWLSWFDPDLAVHLGSMLQRLHPLLGPFRGHSQGGEPELEGLDDLRLRGSYEHLLATEWLLAEEIPDEFLRRAASGEHLFLAPRPKARRADRAIVALFDAGPLQLGAPRLGHLAIWILLARRAQQAQGEFRWGCLQAPGELLEARTTDHLKKLLNQRTFASPRAPDLASWRKALEGKGGERWLIGPLSSQPEMQPAPVFTHRVSLQRALQGTALEVSLFERGTERGVQLKLPEPADAVPLLRGVFNREATAEHYTSDSRAIALARPPVISIDGTRVGIALRDEPAALVFRIPRSAQEKPATPRYQRWSPGYGALAISFMAKRTGVLLSDDRELRFWGTSLAMRPRPPQELFHAPGSIAAWLPLAWLKAAKAQRVCVIDQSKRLLCWDSVFVGKSESTADGSLQPIANNVLGMVQINKGLLVYAYYENGIVWFSRLGATGGPEPAKHFCAAGHDATVLFGGRGCAVRVEQDPAEVWSVGTWKDFHPSVTARLPGDSRAIGLMYKPGNQHSGLITLDRKILRIHSLGGGNEMLYSAPDRIVTHAVCPNTSLIALVTERRQFVVVSAATRELRLSVQTSQQSNAIA